jgi:hypothetical protein
MLQNIKHREVSNKVVSEYFKYYKFLSYETFISQKTNKPCKLQKNSKLVYTMAANQFARLVKTNHFVTNDDDKKFIRFDAQVVASSLGITRQTVMTKIKHLVDLGLLVTEGKNLIHVPKPNVSDARSTFVDKKGVERLTYAQIPKYLIEHDYYKALTENAVIYYAFVRERHLQSIQNNMNKMTYVDKHGKTCCWFTNDAACDLLGINEDTLKKDRDILYAKGLLKSKRFGKALAFYAYEPVHLPSENEKTSEETNDKTSEADDTKKPSVPSIIEKLGLLNLKVGVENFEKLGLSNTGFSNTSSSKTISNDLYDMKTSNKDKVDNTMNTNQTSHNSAILEFENYQKQSITKHLPEYLASYFNNFDVQEIKIIKDNLFKAKKAYFNNLKTIANNGLFIEYYSDVEFTVESLEDELHALLKRLHGKRVKDNERISDMNKTGYIFTSFKNVFISAYNDFYSASNKFNDDLKQAKFVFNNNLKNVQENKKIEKPFNQKAFDEMTAELDALGVY